MAAGEPSSSTVSEKAGRVCYQQGHAICFGHQLTPIKQVEQLQLSECIRIFSSYLKPLIYGKDTVGCVLLNMQNSTLSFTGHSGQWDMTDSEHPS